MDGKDKTTVKLFNIKENFGKTKREWKLRHFVIVRIIKLSSRMLVAQPFEQNQKWLVDIVYLFNYLINQDSF